MRKSTQILAATTLSVIILDQLCKLWVSENHSYEINNGIALSIFHNLSWVGTALNLVGIVIVGWVYWKHVRVKYNSTPMNLAIGLTFGGGLSNLIDRIRLGGVIDYIELGLIPTFNLGDVSVCLGVFLLLALVIKQDYLNSMKNGA